MENLGSLKGAIEAAARDCGVVREDGKDVTAQACLASVAEYLNELNSTRLSTLFFAVAYYLQNSGDDRTAKERVAISFYTLMQNAELHASYSRDLALFTSAVYRMQTKGTEGAI